MMDGLLQEMKAGQAEMKTQPAANQEEAEAREDAHQERLLAFLEGLRSCGKGIQLAK